VRGHRIPFIPAKAGIQRNKTGFPLSRGRAERGIGQNFPHGATPCLPNATAYFTASMIFT
jgi:hypothetical protein